MKAARKIVKLRIACLQTNANAGWKNNLARIDSLVSKAIFRKSKLIALPENFCSRGSSAGLPELALKVTPAVLEKFCAWAKSQRVAFILGSLIERSSIVGRYYNTSYLISEKGRIAARYRKIHLFDVNLAGRIANRESKHIKPGNKVVTGRVWNIPVGLTICYDLRFPELFRRLTQLGSRVIFVPSNFTFVTGKAHWEVLLRARAIENQVYIVAPGQAGKNPVTGVLSYGHSMIVDPWGKVLAQSHTSGEGIVMADLDFSSQIRLRKSFPVLNHRVL